MLNPASTSHPVRGSLARVAALGLLSVLAAGPAAAVQSQPDWEAVEITREDLGSGIQVLFGRGGNIAISTGEDGTLMVDDQYAPLTEKILAAVGEVTDDPVRFVVNTHWHSDHTGGNENLGRAGGIIVAHQNVRRRMNPAEFADLVGRSEQASADALPVVTFESGVTFHWNGLTIEAVHQPQAHTDGDSAIFFGGANVVHMGDLFFNGAFPFIDVDSGGGIHGLIAAVDAVAARTDGATRIIPGHGPVTDRAALLAYGEALRAARERVRARIEAGESEEEAAAAAAEIVTGIGEDLGWSPDSTGFVSAERFVRLTHRSLSNGSGGTGR